MLPSKDVTNRYIILQADDLGLTRSFNQGILDCAQSGFLSSCCLTVNGPAFEHAIEEVLPKIPEIGVGVHLNLSDGATRRKTWPKRSPLYDAHGHFKGSFGSTFWHRNNKTFLAEIKDEFRSQIEFLLKFGPSPDHLNSHNHIHAINEVFDMCCGLAMEYEIPFIRLPRERFYWSAPFSRHLRTWYPINTVKWALLNTLARKNSVIAQRAGIKTNHSLFGILYTGNMSWETLTTPLRRKVTQGEIVEALLHPAVIDASTDEDFLKPALRDYIVNPARETERQALKNPNLPAALAQNGWTLTTYRDLEQRADNERPLTPAPDKVSHEAYAKFSPLRTFVFLDETPFHHPEYLRRLHLEASESDIIGLAIVRSPDCSNLQKYLLRNWSDLGLGALFKLALKRIGIGLAGKLPVGLRGEIDSSVKATATRYNIPFMEIDSVKDGNFMEWLREFAPDVVLSSNSLIFKDELLALPRLACINRHTALLPEFGGVLPLFRAIQHGRKFAGTSVHIMVPGVDEGPVISRKWFPIFPEDTVEALYGPGFVLSFDATCEALRALQVDPQACIAKAQSDAEEMRLEPSYFSFPSPEDWKEFRSRGGRFA